MRSPLSTNSDALANIHDRNGYALIGLGLTAKKASTFGGQLIEIPLSFVHLAPLPVEEAIVTRRSTGIRNESIFRRC
jgi:hypothetical protein